jgi:16S rRNA (uracil1498-N3)-methyltransferase
MFTRHHNKGMSHIPRIYLPGVHADSQAPVTEAVSHHLTRVLRLREAAPLYVFDGEGREYAARLAQVGGRVGIDIGALHRSEAPPPLPIHLFVGISRHTRMEWTLEKAVELGASSVHPLLTERSRVRLDERRAERKLEHWQSIVTAATAQSGRCRLSELRPPRPLSQLWEEGFDGTRLILHPEAGNNLADLPRPAGNLALLVGPESGFSAEELGRAEASGWIPARLGPHVLRAETAGPAALAAVQVLWGSWAGNPG